ncbi:MAG: glycosyltransferase family 4 protein [Alphaproteobacteria bacterium]
MRFVRVGIDLTALLPVHTGVDRYLTSLVRSLAAVDRDTRYELFVNREDRALFHGLPENFRVSALAARPRPVRLLFQQAVLPVAAARLGLDVLHSPSFIMPMVRGSCRHLLTIHDMTSFTLPYCHVPLRRSRPYKLAVETSIGRADLVSVPSPSVLSDVLELVNGIEAGRVRVIPAGIDEEFRPLAGAELGPRLRKLGIEWPYVLFVGTIEPRKNVQGLIAAFELAVERGGIPEHLVLAGMPGWDAERVVVRVRQSPLRDRVHFTGYVPSSELPALYAGASLFAWPSLQEGFGFPPLEAMGSGVAVVATRTSSLADNLDGAAELVPPGDAPALADAMLRLLRDGALRKERIDLGRSRASRFRGDVFARATLDGYRELAAMRR